MNDILVKSIKPNMWKHNIELKNFSSSMVTFQFPDEFVEASNGVVRLIAKDISKCTGNQPGENINDDVDARVGTISFNREYFLDVSESNLGNNF